MPIYIYPLHLAFIKKVYQIARALIWRCFSRGKYFYRGSGRHRQFAANNNVSGGRRGDIEIIASSSTNAAALVAKAIAQKCRNIAI